MHSNCWIFPSIASSPRSCGRKLTGPSSSDAAAPGVAASPADVSRLPIGVW